MRKENILIIDNSTGITGALKAIVGASSHLSDRYQFIFVLPIGSNAIPYVNKAGFETHSLRMIEISKRPQDIILYFPYLLLNTFKLHTLIRRKQVKILHVNDFYNMLGVTSKLFSTVRLITHVRRLPASMSKFLASAWLKIHDQVADKIICVSQAVKNQVYSDKAVVVYDFMPQEERHPQKIIESKTEVTLLYLANYIKGKGQDMALQAFAKAYKQYPCLKLIYIGGNLGLKKNVNFKLSLQEEVKKIGLEKEVSFRDFVMDVELEIKKADIAVNFSEAESFSFTCMEALVYGTPLITSDCGGPAELFESGVSGMLIENGNILALTQAMVQLAKDVAMRKNFSDAGKVYVKHKFASENTVELLHAVYDDILRD